jgi:hypothetical protein
MKLGRIVATLYCGAVLSLQSYAVFSTTDYNNWYWPFVNYPMYSNSFHAGESFLRVELRAVPCDSPRDAFRLGEDDLHLKWLHFSRLVHKSAAVRRADLDTEPQPGSDSTTEPLLHFIATYVPRHVCRVQVWRQRFTIGPRGLEYPGQPWEIAREWVLAPPGSGGLSVDTTSHKP